MEEVTQEQFDELRNDVKQILVLLTGNGNPERGVIVRLDRLEQWRQDFERAKEKGNDLVERLLMPLAADAIKFAAAGAAFVIIGHLFGFIK